MRSLKGNLSGYLPTPAFVMAKKNTKILKAGASIEAPAFVFVLEKGEGEELFSKMLEAMGILRKNAVVFDPVLSREEMDTQIKLSKPKMLIAFGEKAAKILLGTDAISALRGKTHDYQGTKLVTTYHPAYLLRNPPAKKDCWEDLQFAMKEIGWK